MKNRYIVLFMGLWGLVTCLGSAGLVAADDIASGGALDATWKRHMEAGMSAHKQGDYAGGVGHFEAALKIAESFGEGDSRLAVSLSYLALLYDNQGRYGDAEPLYKRALVISENVLGHLHPDTASSLNNLAKLYKSQGRYSDAEPLYIRALAIREKISGPRHLHTAPILNNLAELYRHQSRYGDAEPLHIRALAIWENALGAEHPNTAASLNNLALLYDTQGRYGEAEPLYIRALAIREKALGSEHPDTALSLSNLAELYRFQGRYSDAEPLYIRALAIREKVLGAEHPDTAINLNILASLYDDQGRYGDAEPLYIRALAIKEKTLGPEHPSTATSLNDLALLYQRQDRYLDAESLHTRALAIWEQALGAEHPDVARGLNNLAGLYDTQGRYADAEPLYKRALVITEKALGSEHPDTANRLGNLAGLYRSQGRYLDAEPLYKRALKIGEKAFGPEHPDTATDLNGLAWLYDYQGQIDKALEFVRKATTIHRNRALAVSSERSQGILSEQQSVSYVFTHHVSLLEKAKEKDPKQQVALTAEAFEVGQLARATSTARAVARMAARFGAGDDALAKLARKRQDALARWQKMDDDFVKTASLASDKRNLEKEQQLREQRETLDKQLLKLDADLAEQFPEYVELANPKPLTLKEAQSLLDPKEALLAYLLGEKESHLWVIRADRAHMYRLALGKKDIAERVKFMRQKLDSSGIQSLKDIGTFPVKAAHALYEALIAPAKPLITDATHIMVVPHGALQSLPFGVLVSEAPIAPLSDLKSHAQVPWLAKDYALTTLPSVSALRALRRFATASTATKPFAGFGDPLLEGDGGEQRGINLAALFSRGTVADVKEVRRLPRLPDTATELKAMAKALHAKPGTLHLQAAATETKLRSLDLSPYKILAFATHGLMAKEAKEFQGMAEPALVFTPPSKGSELDDGLLTVSEIAQLKLDADWVILSACNTASSDGTPGAEGLSGLAKAFFYAGSRALLVSHWAVETNSAVALTTGAFAALAKNPKLGRSRALRQSMLALMNDSEHPYYAHPMFWAPFVVVGEGLR